MREVDPGWANWFAGFVDGEGCFLFSINEARKSYHIGLQIHLRDDDLPLLLEIQERLQMGNISRRKPSIPQLESHPGSRPSAVWSVYRQNDCLRLVHLFEEYSLRSKKRRDYEVWGRAVRELCKGAASRNEAKLRYWQDRLKLVRQYDPYEVEEFEPEGIQLEFWGSSND